MYRADFGVRASVCALLILATSSCKRQPEQKRIRQIITLSGPPLVYICQWTLLTGSQGSGKDAHAQDRLLIEINWPEVKNPSADLVGLVFDAQTEDPAAAIQVHLDTGILRIDRFLTLDGKPIGNESVAVWAARTRQLQMTLLEIATAILEEAPRARAAMLQKQAKPDAAQETHQVSFQHQDKWLLNADFSSTVMGPNGYGPLPIALRSGTSQICMIVK
jgi:hypothetical protein